MNRKETRFLIPDNLGMPGITFGLYQTKDPNWISAYIGYPKGNLKYSTYKSHMRTM